MRLYLPPRPTPTMRRGGSTSRKFRSPQPKRSSRALGAEARAGAAAVGVHAGQPPVLEQRAHELRVVGDVREVLEDLLARAVDR